MANLLDETTGPVNDKGREIHVIDKQLPVKVGIGSTIFEAALWVAIPALVLAVVYGLKNSRTWLGTRWLRSTACTTGISLRE